MSIRFANVPTLAAQAPTVMKPPSPIQGPAVYREVIMNKQNEQSTQSGANKPSSPAPKSDPAKPAQTSGKPDAAPVKSPGQQSGSGSNSNSNSPISSVKDQGSGREDQKSGRDSEEKSIRDSDKSGAQAPKKS